MGWIIGLLIAIVIELGVMIYGMIESYEEDL
jgi:hypothetical protein